MAARKTPSPSSSSSTPARKKARPTMPSSHKRTRDDDPRPAGRGAGGPSAGGSRAPMGRPKGLGLARRMGAGLAPRRATEVPEPRGKAPKAEGAARRRTKPQSDDGSLASESARTLATAVAVAGLEKKAAGLEILDVAGRVDYADFLVVMTGRSDRHVTSLAQAIEDALRKKGKRALSVEGMSQASWVLMDFGDVVVHVFQDEARSLYDIEGLWMDAKRVSVPGAPEFS